MIKDVNFKCNKCPLNNNCSYSESQIVTLTNAKNNYCKN
jgi:hypothetical protein